MNEAVPLSESKKRLQRRKRNSKASGHNEA
jgi:hypothetical protein